MGAQKCLGLGRPGPFISNSMLRAPSQNGSWRVIERLLKICKHQSLRPFLCKHFNQVWFGQDPSFTASRALAPGQSSPDSYRRREGKEQSGSLAEVVVPIFRGVGSC